MKKKIYRLIARIAEEIGEPEEAHRIVASLEQIDDWEVQIKKALTNRKRREKQRVTSANLRATNLGLAGDLTPQDWFETLDYFTWKCAYCQEDFSYEHLEHFVPLSKKREGTTAWNCVPSCEKCNFRKSAKDMDDWLRQLSLETLEDPFVDQLKRVQDYLQSRNKPTLPTEKQIGLPKLGRRRKTARRK